MRSPTNRDANPAERVVAVAAHWEQQLNDGSANDLGTAGDTWRPRHARSFCLVWLVGGLWRIILGKSRVPMGE